MSSGLPRSSKHTITVGKTIRQRRAALNLSQRDLDAKCGVSQAFISQVERGCNSISVDTLTLIAKGLGCSVAELVGLGARQE